jgi:capsid protein
MVYIKANNQRREIFEGKQQEVIQEVGDELITSKIYRAVTNGGIRWNSTYLMIERAILLKDAISLYQGNTEAPIDPRDELTGSD